MESSVLTEMIAVIRAERERRASLLRDEDPDAAYDNGCPWIGRSSTNSAL